MSAAVTIVTPAWNATAYIAETVRSVQEQTLQDWDWIIVDDGSSDDTVRVILNESRGDKRIRVVTQPNRGVSAARNRGLNEAGGSLVALLDADDLWLPNNLSRKVLAFSERPEIDFLYSNAYKQSESDGQRFRSGAGKGDRILENLLLWNGDVIPSLCSNLVLRRRVVESGLRFDARFSTAADLDFAFRLAAVWRGYLLDDYLVIYRVHKKSMSRNLQLLEDDQLAVYRHAQELGLFRSWAFRRRCFARLYLILAGNWWVGGANRTRATSFITKAVAAYPPIAIHLLVRVLRRPFRHSGV